MLIYFLLEEQSMEAFLKVYLPRVLPPNVHYQLIPHQGKQDLQASIPRKLQAIRTPNTRFVILHDQDSHDCTELKKALLKLAAARKDDVLVRIVCTELESWYLGDFKALKDQYPHVNWNLHMNKRKFREPDKLKNAKEELRKLVSSYQPLNHSAEIANLMSIGDSNENRSVSFQAFLTGLNRIINA